ncbi:MAG: hypothetical protein ABIE23_05980 [archaeon]
MNSNKLTELSFKELIKTTKLFNIHGLHPIIIGGWAVYYYTKGAGSIDIDLVLPTKQVIQVFEKYSKQYGFKKDRKAKTRTLFRKETGEKEIELDIFTLSDKNTLASNKSIEIPWKLADKNSKEWKINKDVTARVPEKEVLLLYKTAALKDRQYKIKTWANLSKFSRDRLKAKIEKDKRDIQGLLKLEINQEKLNELLEKTKFKKYYDETLKEIERE